VQKVFDRLNVLNVIKLLLNDVVSNLINEKFTASVKNMLTKVVEINYMFAKIVDIHRRIQAIITNISNIYILIHR